MCLVTHLEKGWSVVGSASAFTLLVDAFIQKLNQGPINGYRSPVNESEKAWVDEGVELLIKEYSTAPVFTDVLGELYESLSSKSWRSSLGQFFTPNAVANMMAEMSGASQDLGPSIASIEMCRAEGRLFRIYEPTAGSGRLILNACRKIYESNPSFIADVSVTCVDLDFQCVRMLVANFAAAEAIHRACLGELTILRGNSLSGECVVEAYSRIGKNNLSDKAA